MNTMIANIITAGLVAYIGYIFKSVPFKFLSWISKKYSFSITVISTNRYPYEKLNTWILSHKNKMVQNHINVVSKYISTGITMVVSIDYGSYIFKLDKFTLITINKSLIQNDMNEADQLSITIYGKYKKYMNEIKQIIENKENTENITVFPLTDDYDAYYSPKKSFDDIFLDDDVKIKIIKHLENFKANKPLYLKHGITYKTGILLYGEPGCGKTTLAKAIATYMKYNMHIINMKSYEKEVDFIKRMINIPKQSIILFEDIDCVCSNRNISPSLSEDELKEEKSNKYKLGLLLNAIDGSTSPNEVIFIATTNHIEQLDDALIRDGRFDLKLKVNPLSKKTAIEMCDKYSIDYNKILYNENFPINPAHLQNKIFNYKIGGNVYDNISTSN